MTEDWIVRVDGKEYGPVDVDMLREWRREGRLISTNEVRRVDQEGWIVASELPDVFADSIPPALPPRLRDFETPKTWNQIIADTLRLYREGFVPFMAFGLLVAVPMFILQWTLPTIPIPDLMSGSTESMAVPAPPPISLVMLLVVLVLWPISTAGFQVVADAILRGQPASLGAQFSNAIRCWGRVLGAGILVYLSYAFWILVPLAAMLAPINTGNLFLVVLVILIAGAAMAYMNARLFINFLFWHQTTVLAAHPPMVALTESKELARSLPDVPPFERPLYRGAIIASVWLFVLLALIFGIDLIFAFIRVAGATSPEQALELAKNAARAQTPDGLTIAANLVIAVTNLLLRPLMAVAFVVLYYDAKARLANPSEASNPANNELEED